MFYTYLQSLVNKCVPALRTLSDSGYEAVETGDKCRRVKSFSWWSEVFDARGRGSKNFTVGGDTRADCSPGVHTITQSQ